MKMNKLACSVLAISLSMGAQASDEQMGPDLESSDNSSTYWGVGIGSVLGAIIAGPPGAAVGATLGGTYGWGHDRNEALEQSELELTNAKRALQRSEIQQQSHRSELSEARQKVFELRRTNAAQAAQLSDLVIHSGLSDEGPDLESDDASILQKVASHYTQEIYYRQGESDVPEYAKPRLDGLTEFLRAHPNLHVTLKGFTDRTGSADFNEALARARAEAVRDVLLDQGLPDQRVSITALGEREASTSSGDTGNYILDRRVSIELSLADPLPEVMPQTNQPVLVTESVSGGDKLAADTVEPDTVSVSAVPESPVSENPISDNHVSENVSTLENERKSSSYLSLHSTNMEVMP